jgi:hypothetical protein
MGPQAAVLADANPPASEQLVMAKLAGAVR